MFSAIIAGTKKGRVMGEIAEMMLDGTLCQGCGELLIDPGGEPQGFPGFCAGCGPDEAETNATAERLFPRTMKQLRKIKKGNAA
jgi:hypothetical protein